MKEKTSSEVLDDFSLEVKKIEAEAAQIIEDATQKREQMLTGAKTESVTLISKKQQQLESQKEEKVQKQKEKIGADIESNSKQGKKELKEFETKSRNNISKASDFVVKKLNQKIEEL